MIKIIKKEDCCGCRACEQVCPKKCVSMNLDEEGFFYPSIKIDECIECNLCKQVCPIQDREEKQNKHMEVYAVKSKSIENIRESSSGGAFSVFAEYIIQNNGVVCGCAFNDKFIAEHLFVDDIKDIKKLKGSKYVQSDTLNTYKETKEYLKQNRLVIYVGTPCQIDGLKRFLDIKKIRCDKLITIDLICHGVPSPGLFNKYIEYIQKKSKIELTDFKFRDKSRGEWGLVYSYSFKKNNKIKKKVKSASLSPYYNAFLNNMIFRPVCYECKYAKESRISDITLGDFWGVENYHQEFDRKYGVSALILNSEKGKKLFDENSHKFDYINSKFEYVKSQNSNLYKPSERPDIRSYIYKNYEYGFEYLSKHMIKTESYILSIIKNSIPNEVKIKIKDKVRNLG